jgi:hypothetical protein
MEGRGEEGAPSLRLVRFAPDCVAKVTVVKL